MTGRELIEKYKQLLLEAAEVEMTEDEQDELFELGHIGQSVTIKEDGD